MWSSCAGRRGLFRRALGGTWVGTVSKLDGVVMGITSKYFYDYQLPPPPEVNETIRELFQ
jgi:hypothetical protein